jgi:hypothetical protein
MVVTDSGAAGSPANSDRRACPPDVEVDRRNVLNLHTDRGIIEPEPDAEPFIPKGESVVPNRTHHGVEIMVLVSVG